MINPINAPELTASIQHDYRKATEYSYLKDIEIETKKPTFRFTQMLKALLIKASIKQVFRT